MKNSVPAQLTLFPMPQRKIRGLSYTNAIRSGLRPYEYKSVVEASCMGKNTLSWVLLPGHIHG